MNRDVIKVEEIKHVETEQATGANFYPENAEKYNKGHDALAKSKEREKKDEENSESSSSSD